MKLEHLNLHQKVCEAGEPTFPGGAVFVAHMAWRVHAAQWGWGCKTGIWGIGYRRVFRSL